MPIEKTNGEDISVRCFFEGERALHGSVHEDTPSRRVDKKNIIKDGCNPMTMEEALDLSVDTFQALAIANKSRPEIAARYTEAASILRKRETDGVEETEDISLFECLDCEKVGDAYCSCPHCGSDNCESYMFKSTETVKQTLQITKVRSAASFEKVE